MMWFSLVRDNPQDLNRQRLAEFCHSFLNGLLATAAAAAQGQAGAIMLAPPGGTPGAVTE
jgi:hypothetical protein